jgi:hypothetical protein
MNQLDPKSLSILIALISLVGVIIGGSITIIGNLFIKRQERLAQISKLIAEKRLGAYEEVISSVRFASFGMGEMEDGKYFKQPLILNDLDSYNQWSAEYIIMCRRVTHLIDRDLDRNLWVLKNYLVYLSETLNHFTDANGKYSDPGKAKLLGAIVYDDFIQLTSAILEEAGKFFNKSIFHSQFTPAAIGSENYNLPKSFQKLALFSKREEINQLIRQ